MATQTLSLTSLSLLLGFGTCLGQEPDPHTLTHYLESLHWDAAQSGPLIAIDPATVWSDSDRPKDLSAFQRKMVKSGALNVVRLTWEISVDEEHLPNAYDSLSSDEKLMFLLATLNPGQIERLENAGLSANDLAGQQRGALLSMIPKSLGYMEGETTGPGGFRSSQTEPRTLPDDQLSQVRLQLRKGVNVSFDARTEGRSQTSSSVSSLSYRGPAGTLVAQSTQSFGGLRPWKLIGQVVDSADKKSDLARTDRRLSRDVALKSGTIGELVGEVRDATGVEVYADARITSLKVSAYGSSVNAGDLLLGLARSLDGTIRRVGPVYVVTSDLEGEQSRETRLNARDALGRISIQGQIDAWKAALKQRRLPDSLPFSKDDPLQAATIPSQAMNSDYSDWKSGWVPVSSLPGGVGAAITAEQARQSENRRNWPKNAPPLRDPGPPIPELQDKARVSTVTGYRFVLPDGRPLETHRWDVPSNFSSTVTIDRNKPPTFPLDPAKLVDGSAVLIRSDDAKTVADNCAKLKSAGIREVWLDSRSSTAIQAATASGLQIDLVVRPWAVQRGESCSDPDRTLVGQNGSQLDQLPELARYDPETGETARFRDSFSPADSAVTDHFSRLVNSIPGKGIHGIILFDAEPEGYQAPPRPGTPMHYRGVTMVNGKTMEPSLAYLEPRFFEFGYTTSLRLAFLRKFQMDPVDLGDPQFVTEYTISIPYFRGQPFMRPFDPGPRVQFPTAGPNPKVALRDWQEMRNSKQTSKLDELLGKLYRENRPLYVKSGSTAFNPNPQWVNLYEPKTTGQAPATRQAFISIIPMNPAMSEDGRGNITGAPQLFLTQPMCFDLREVPAGSLDAYLKYMFKRSS